MAKKKSPAKKRAYAKQVKTDLNNSPEITAFEIEREPPPYSYKGNNIAALALFAKIDKTVPDLQEGNAFIIPADRRSTVHRYLKQHYGNRVFLVNKIVGNDKVLRVYFMGFVSQKQKPKK